MTSTPVPPTNAPPHSPQPPTATPKWVGPLMVMMGAMAVGYAPIGLRFSEFEPQATAFWRYTLALPFLAVFLFKRDKRIDPPSIHSLLTGLFFALDIALWHTALTKTSVANATFIVNLGGIGVGILAWIVLKERPNRLWPIAAILAISGAWFLSHGQTSGPDSALEGDTIALIAAVMRATYFFFVLLARRQQDPITVLFWATATECLIALLITLGAGEQILPKNLSQLLFPLSLAIIAQLAGQGLIIAGIGRTTAAIAGVLVLLQPVTSAIFASALFDESLTQLQLGGSLLILFGLWLANKA